VRDSARTANVSQMAGMKRIAIRGFDPAKEPFIEELDDGSLRIVFEAMPPSNCKNPNELLRFRHFRLELEYEAGTPVIHDDREIFIVPSPRPDSAERLERFLSTVRQPRPKKLEGTCFGLLATVRPLRGADSLESEPDDLGSTACLPVSSTTPGSSRGRAHVGPASRSRRSTPPRSRTTGRTRTRAGTPDTDRTARPRRRSYGAAGHPRRPATR